jgi:hypothetical protein
MANATLAELIEHRCQTTLEWLSELSDRERFYQLIHFQVELARLDFGTGQLMQEVRQKHPPGSQRAKALSALSDCRLMTHSYLNEIEHQLQSLSMQSRRA